MICKICNMEFDPRGRHLRHYHNMGSKEYYDKHILENIQDKFCSCCGREKEFYGMNVGYYTCNKDKTLCGFCVIKKGIAVKKEDKQTKEDKLRLQRESRNAERIKNKDKYKYVCKVCGIGLDSTLVRHIKDTHKLDYYEYLELYDKERIHKFCESCGSPVKYKKDYRSTVSFYVCCSKHSEGAYKREREFRDTIEENGKSKKYNIANRPDVKIKQSSMVKLRILNGEFTPDVTNSWCHSRIVISIDEKQYKFRSSFEAIFWLEHRDLDYEATRIPYYFEDKLHTYIVDFTDNVNKVIYEIKPFSLVEEDKNVAKFESAILWCKQNEYTFKIITEKEIISELHRLSEREIDIIQKDKKLLRTYNNFIARFHEHIKFA